MIKRTIFLISLVLMTLQSCYMAKYYRLKKDYAVLLKDYSDENRELIKTRKLYEQKTDTVKNLSLQNIGFIKGIIYNDSISDSISRYMKLKDISFSESDKAKAATVNHITKLSAEEKGLYYYLNLARISPGIYAEKYLQPFLNSRECESLLPEACNSDTLSIWYMYYYERSLYIAMKKMQAAPALNFDEACRVSAECHAISTGKKGLVTHSRQDGCTSDFSGECCYYGSNDPQRIITGLLIDGGVPSLGHRLICLDRAYSILGVAIRSHTSYGNNAVLDFKY